MTPHWLRLGIEQEGAKTRSFFGLSSSCLGVFLFLSLTSSQAEAGGLYFSDRGVRPMGRAGAFVAGADDLGAIWYNPAGLADAGTSFLADFSWLRFNVDYTRTLIVRDADGTLRYPHSPTVSGSSPVIPLPTLAWSYNFGERKEFTIAGGVLAPYVALASYSDTVTGPNGLPQPSPARYTLGSFNGSLLALPGLWAAWKPIEQLRFGAGVMALIGTFKSTITFSASPQDRLIGAPEQPEYDANAQLSVGPIFAPTANAGVTFVPHEMVRVGISGQLPMIISAPATFQVRMPSDVVFDNAKQNGTDAHVRFELPAVFRVGVEVRPVRALRVEVAYVREFWTTHKSIDAVPQGMSIDGITGLPPHVAIPTISIPRGFEDSNSYRLGGEYGFEVAGYRLDARAGMSYETSAVPPGYLSLSSLDFDKVVISLGGGLYIGEHWRFDALYAHLFASSVYVDPAIAQISRINPIKGNAPPEPVNGGQYSAAADLIGVGLQYKF
jgi:long-chain fatty acid transport protein